MTSAFQANTQQMLAITENTKHLNEAVTLLKTEITGIKASIASGINLSGAAVNAHLDYDELRAAVRPPLRLDKFDSVRRHDWLNTTIQKISQWHPSALL